MSSRLRAAGGGECTVGTLRGGREPAASVGRETQRGNHDRADPIPTIGRRSGRRGTAARASYVAQHRGSATANDRARVVMPGGNTRSVLHFDPFPFRVTSAADATLIDVDGHSYVDFCGNYTAGLPGHSPGLVRDAIIEALDQGWAVGATHNREIELAELVCERFASIEQVRFTNSGTEANLMAIGTALHHTGRTGVGVFDHAYHGGVLGFGDLDAEHHHPLNVPHRFIVAPFDDEAGLDGLFSDTDLGGVVIEAVQGSGGCRRAGPSSASGSSPT